MYVTKTGLSVRLALLYLLYNYKLAYFFCSEKKVLKIHYG